MYTKFSNLFYKNSSKFILTSINKQHIKRAENQNFHLLLSRKFKNEILSRVTILYEDKIETSQVLKILTMIYVLNFSCVCLCMCVLAEEERCHFHMSQINSWKYIKRSIFAPKKLEPKGENMKNIR